MRLENVRILPNTVQFRTLLRFEFIKLMNRGAVIFLRLIGLLAVSGIILINPGKFSSDYGRVLIPGLATIFLLHPFLSAGRAFSRGFGLPCSWRCSPGSWILFIFLDIPGKLILNILGLGIFAFILSTGGYSVIFLLDPRYWLYYLALIPGALGLGLLIQAVYLALDTESGGWEFRRLIEFLGGVFIRPEWLPAGIYYISFLFPHAYLSELGRVLIKNSKPAGWYYPGGVLVCILLLVVGGLIFKTVLSKSVQQGKMERTCR